LKFSVSGEGLRIELETEHGMFFVSGSAAPTPAGQELLRVLAKEISQLPNRLVIEGHTDAKPFRNADASRGYSGFADQKPFNERDPFDSKNRRVSVVVRFTA
jgi:chemotaxis protein MotB